MRKRSIGILSLILIAGAFSCKKIVLNALAKPLVPLIWEDRPAGISCTPTTSPTTFDGTELTFDQNHMFCINLTIDADDFEVLRHESRFGPSILEKDGTASVAAAMEYLIQCDVPFPSHYNWYSANANIDGIVTTNVGLRKKGFIGSIFSTAPSMKINAGYFTAGQTIGSAQNVTLNNNAEDPTRIMHCINYRMFEWASYPAPRANLANVTVNTEPLGVYTHLEAIDDNFLQNHFGNTSGDLYEGQLIDFKEDWITRWESKTDATDEMKARIVEVAQVLETASDANLEAELNAVINLDNYYTFWAMEVLLRHVDGYAGNRNNFMIYFDPADGHRGTFIPWGLNYFRIEDAESFSGYVGAEIPRRLSRVPALNQKMLDRLQWILDNVWDESAINLLVDNFALQVESGQVNPNYTAEVDRLKNWVLGRRAEIETFISNGLPQGDSEPVSACFGNE